jgi:serine/threonine protein kinase
MPVLNPGMVLNQRYQLQRPIGRGGFSVVWLAVDLVDTRPVALKISLPDKDMAGEQPERMEKQHATTRHLDQPNLLRSLDYFRIEDSGCLVFDYMANGTLHSKVKTTGTLTEAEIAKVMLEIGGALHYLHSQALIHFDVKPENILINAKGDYFLSDFDTASRLENSMVRVSRIYADTPQYRSPEHLRGAAELSEKIDIFAFGTTLFELCEGIMEKEYGIGMMLLSGAEKPALEQGKYSKRMEQIIQACWNHNPADRPTADALCSYAKHFLEHKHWPHIIEYNPNDKPYADLPLTASSDTVRVTVGRPTVIDPNPLGIRNNPSIEPKTPSIKKQETTETVVENNATPKFTPPNYPPPPPIKSPSEIKRSNPLFKYGIPAILILVLAVLGIVFGRKMMNNSKFQEYYEQSTTLLHEGKLKQALDAVLLAKEIHPDDSSAIKLRREIFQAADLRHSEQLSLVKGYIDSHDPLNYATARQILETNREDASILRGGDSTEYYLALIPTDEPAATEPEVTTPSEPTSTPAQNTTSRNNETVATPTRPRQDEDAAELERIRKANAAYEAEQKRKREEAAQMSAAEKAQLLQQQEDIRIAKEENNWNAAKQTNTESSLNKWTNHPKYGSEAKAMIAKIKADQKKVIDPVQPVTTLGSNRSFAGVGYKKIDLNTCTNYNVQQATITLTPSQLCALESARVFSSDCGRLTMRLSGGGVDETETFELSKGNTPMTFSELDGANLKAGQTYTLTLSVSKSGSCGGGDPKLLNAAACGESADAASLNVNYQGKVCLFSLKYRY